MNVNEKYAHLTDVDLSLKCANCKFYVPYKEEADEDLGRCRRYPPVIAKAEFEFADWVTVWFRDSCGEFQKTTQFDD